jgi:hypothetical protein
MCVYICNTERYPASFVVQLGLAHGLDPGQRVQAGRANAVDATHAEAPRRRALVGRGQPLVQPGKRNFVAILITYKEPFKLKDRKSHCY